VEPEIRARAEAALTANQFRAWELSVAGLSQRDVALNIGVSRTTAVDRIDRAWQILGAHGIRSSPAGTPYLEETA
jgi:DNA-binding CsgD family transcriptional regulator